jgi:erythromycin esterase
MPRLISVLTVAVFLVIPAFRELDPSARAVAAPGGGQGSNEGGPADRRVAWLKKHAAALRSIDPADEEFADLEPIRQAIGDARIVLLSEQSHGDGATFHARIRLIKFLHQKCGFDVLAFESGLYDCRKAWQFLREGKMSPLEALRQGVFDIWMSSEQVQPLVDYLGRQAKTPRPLEVCGFDCQFTANASSRYLPDDLTIFLNKLPADVLSPAQRAAVVQGSRQLARPAERVDTVQEEAFAACRKALATVNASDSIPGAELSFWRQFMDSVIAQAEAQPALTTRPALIERSYGNIRDPQMAKNFLWLAQTVYPKRKIIVWAAAFHLMRNQATVAMVTEPGKLPSERKTVFPYVQIATMGNDVAKVLGKQTYSIFFTAAEGKFGSVRVASPQPVAPVVPGSLEDLLVKAGCTNAFFNIRNPGADGAWLKERLIARPLGHANYEADWTRVCDGFVFTRTMYPSTLTRATPGEVGSAGGKYQPARDAARLGVPFDRYTTKDALGRTITFYLSQRPNDAKDKLAIALFIQGSGCASVFSKRDGKVFGGLQNLVLSAGRGRLRVLVVEKPGVQFGDKPQRPGSAEEGSAEFRQEHILPRWVEAVNAALKASQQLSDVDWTRTLVIGHSEGGVVAAHVAAANLLVTHVACLAGGGPSQLFDLVEIAGQRRQPDEPVAAAAARVQQVYEGWAKVLADPDNADKLWLGHPYRRWSSFLKTSPREGLLASQAAVFLAHGTADQSVPVASFDVLRAELTAQGRDLTAERLEGCDHGFRKASEPPGSFDGFQELLARFTDWFFKKDMAVTRAIEKDLERLQGTWHAVSITHDGASRPLQGGRAGLQVVVAGDRRTVQAGETIYSRTIYRINPAAKPPTIDVTWLDGAMKGTTLLGIYEIDGDTHRLCLGQEGVARPKEFVSQPNSGHTLTVYKRSPSAAPKEASTDDPDSLRAIVAQCNRESIEAFKKGDMLAVARGYADDATIYFPRGQKVHGRKAIDRYWQEVKGAKDWKLEIIEVGGTKEAIYEVGKSTLTTEVNGKESTYVCDYVVIWKRQKDGTYRTHTDIFN